MYEEKFERGISEERLQKYIETATKKLKTDPGYINFSNLYPYEITIEQMSRLLAFAEKNQGYIFDFSQYSGSLTPEMLSHILDFIRNYRLPDGATGTLILRGNERLPAVENETFTLSRFFHECHGEWNLDLSKCGFSGVYQTVVDSIKTNRTVRKLQLGENRISIYKYSPMADIIRQNAVLEELDIGHGGYYTYQNLADIADALTINRNLRKFSCEIPERAIYHEADELNDIANRNQSDIFQLMYNASVNNQSLEEIIIKMGLSDDDVHPLIPVSDIQNPRVNTLVLEYLTLDTDAVDRLLLVNFPNLTSLSLGNCIFQEGALQRFSEIIGQLQLGSLSLPYSIFRENPEYQNFITSLSASTTIRNMPDLKSYAKMLVHDDVDIRNFIGTMITEDEINILEQTLQRNRDCFAKSQRQEFLGWVFRLFQQEKVDGPTLDSHCLQEVFVNADCGVSELVHRLTY